MTLEKPRFSVGVHQGMEQVLDESKIITDIVKFSWHANWPEPRRSDTHVGIGFIGNYSDVAPPQAAIDALDWLIGTLQAEHPEAQSIEPHWDDYYRNGSCPGRWFVRWQYERGLIDDQYLIERGIRLEDF